MKILISPLPWGYGHALRLIPIIFAVKKNHSVIVATNSELKKIILKNIPDIEVIEVPSVKIFYASNGFLFYISMFLNAFKILILFFKNRLWLKNFLKKNSIDLIISDNNYGFYSKKIRSILIVHHINIILKPPFLNTFVNCVNKFFINKFDEILIPDDPFLRFTQHLSNPDTLKIPFSYIGICSQFQILNNKNYYLTQYEVACILSGPEPQKSLLESIFIKTFSKTNLKTIIVGASVTKIISANLVVMPFSDSNFLKYIIQSSKIVVARAGYSTIMDLIYLKKTAILIPTPYQTEQIYLARRLWDLKFFAYCFQEKFDYPAFNNLSQYLPGFQNNLSNQNVLNFKINDFLCDILQH